MINPILTTKLFIPTSRPNIVFRPSLTQKITEGLTQGGKLTLVPLDGKRQWYRYHHLFVDFLRAELEEDGKKTTYRQEKQNKRRSKADHRGLSENKEVGYSRH